MVDVVIHFSVCHYVISRTQCSFPAFQSFLVLSHCWNKAWPSFQTSLITCACVNCAGTVLYVENWVFWVKSPACNPQWKLDIMLIKISCCSSAMKIGTLWGWFNDCFQNEQLIAYNSTSRNICMSLNIFSVGDILVFHLIDYIYSIYNSMLLPGISQASFIQICLTDWYLFVKHLRAFMPY